MGNTMSVLSIVELVVAATATYSLLNAFIANSLRWTFTTKVYLPIGVSLEGGCSVLYIYLPVQLGCPSIMPYNCLIFHVLLLFRYCLACFIIFIVIIFIILFSTSRMRVLESLMMKLLWVWLLSNQQIKWCLMMKKKWWGNMARVHTGETKMMMKVMFTLRWLVDS